jgi:hypothetical protein
MKRNKGKGKLPPFTALFKHTTKSDAWRALSPGARSVFFFLQSNHNTNMQNSVYLATRAGSAELGGVRAHNITRWLDELDHYGFIVKLEEYRLGVNGKGSAAEYRLTDRYYAGKPPTYDFQNWTGELFKPKRKPVSDAERARLNALKSSRKKQNPVTRSVTACDTVVHKGADARTVKNGNKRDTVVHKGNAADCDTVVRIDSLTISRTDSTLSPPPWVLDPQPAQGWSSVGFLIDDHPRSRHLELERSAA